MYETQSREMYVQGACRQIPCRQIQTDAGPSPKHLIKKDNTNFEQINNAFLILSKIRLAHSFILKIIEESILQIIEESNYI